MKNDFAKILLTTALLFGGAVGMSMFKVLNVNEILSGYGVKI